MKKKLFVIVPFTCNNLNVAHGEVIEVKEVNKLYYSLSSLQFGWVEKSFLHSRTSEIKRIKAIINNVECNTSAFRLNDAFWQICDKDSPYDGALLSLREVIKVF